MLNPWLSLTFQAARLGWEAQSVIALRLMRLAGGGVAGQKEAQRIVPDKMAALSEAQFAGTSAALQGGLKRGRSHVVAKKVLAVYKKRVSANKRRLSK